MYTAATMLAAWALKPPIDPAMADPTRFLQMFTLTRASTLVFRTWMQMKEDRDSGRKWETMDERKERGQIKMWLQCVTTPISITYTLHEILAEGSNMYEWLVKTYLTCTLKSKRSKDGWM